MDEIINSDVFESLEAEVLPSRTYRIVDGRIIGMVEGLDAIRQAVDKILLTERFQHLIYDENYGVELARLIGEDFEFVKADLERTITDAITSDERVESITNFMREQSDKSTLMCSFTVNTVEGNYSHNLEVDL